MNAMRSNHNKISAHFQYKLWMYAAVAAVAVVLWITVFSVLEKNDYDEIISITLFTDEEDFSRSLADDIANNISDITAQSIKEISAERKSPDQSELQDTVTEKLVFRDILIFPEEVVSSLSDGEFNPTLLFYAIREERLGEQLGEFEEKDFFKFNGYYYGIYLNDPDDTVTNNFEKIYSGQTRYVALFSYRSVNLDRLYNVGDEGDRAAIDVVLYLIAPSD